MFLQCHDNLNVLRTNGKMPEKLRIFGMGNLQVIISEMKGGVILERGHFGRIVSGVYILFLA